MNWGLVQNDRPEGEPLEGFEIASEQRVIGDDDVVLGDLFADAVPGGTALGGRGP